MIRKFRKFEIVIYPPPLSQIENGALFIVEDAPSKIIRFLNSVNSRHGYFKGLVIHNFESLEKNHNFSHSQFSSILNSDYDGPIFVNSTRCSHGILERFIETYDTIGTKRVVFVIDASHEMFSGLVKLKQSYTINLNQFFGYLRKFRNEKKQDKKSSTKRTIKCKTVFRTIFSLSTMIAFVFMSLFGSSMQSTRLSSILESMTYFMSTQPINSRIHATYMQNYGHGDEESAKSQSIFQSYQQMQVKGSRYQYNNHIETYLLSGSGNQPIQYKVFLNDYEDYQFESKIIGLSAYSNQNRILMETIRLEQYLITKNPSHYPLNGAESTYFMPSHIADYLIALSFTDDLTNYSDLIGKTITVSFDDEGGIFNSVMSINNIFYTTHTEENMGLPINSEDQVNRYGAVDNNYGQYLTDTIGDFGVSTTRQAHTLFGTTFCFDFYGRNKLLTMMIDDVFGSDYTNDESYIDFFYKGRQLADYGLDLYVINDIYSESRNSFFGAKYIYLGLSLLFLVASIASYIGICRTDSKMFVESAFKKAINLLIFFIPLITMQIVFLSGLVLFGHTSQNISYLNMLGSGFSLFYTIIINLLWIYGIGKKSTKKMDRFEREMYEITI